jgi:hypothetical protein
MGFHRRHIDNNQVITLYREGGIDRVRDWYTKGADALVLEIGIASEIDDLLSLPLPITENDKWNTISEMVSDESIRRGVN